MAIVTIIIDCQRIFFLIGKKTYQNHIFICVKCCLIFGLSYHVLGSSWNIDSDYGLLGLQDEDRVHIGCDQSTGNAYSSGTWFLLWYFQESLFAHATF
jgi:hypothetical protein